MAKCNHCREQQDVHASKKEREQKLIVYKEAKQKANEQQQTFAVFKENNKWQYSNAGSIPGTASRISYISKHL